MAPVVVSQTNGDDLPAIGRLFDGLAFFLVQRVPSRSTFVSRIQVNGGRVVKLEAQADHVVADHLRPDAPPGSISYTFIEAAIKDGKLPDPAAHKAGPPEGTVREVGSVVPGRSTRVAFTAEEDRLLWLWVKKRKDEGGSEKGNEIYKQLEARNPRHTHQSWRDRYIKKLMDTPPAGVDVQVAANAPPTPPTAPDQEDRVYVLNIAGVERHFSQDNFDELFDNAEDVENIDAAQLEEAWEAWAGTKPGHSADEWRQFYDEVVRPAWLERQKDMKSAPENQNHTVTPAAPVDSTLNQSTASGSSRMVANAELAQTDERAKGSQQRKHLTTNKSTETSPAHKRRRINGPGSSPSSEARPGSRSSQVTRSKATPAEPVEISSDEDNRTNQRSKITDLNVYVDPIKLQYREALRETERSYRQEELDAPSSQFSKLPTSDLNNAADRQLQRETDGVARRSTETKTHRQHPRLTSSDASKEADLQLRRESLGDAEHPEPHVASRPELPPATAVSQTHAGSGYGGEDVDQHQVAASAHNALDLLEGSAALTVANLASQNAMHKPEAKRALDLPQDDTQQDQSEFLSYLQNLTAQKGNHSNEARFLEGPDPAPSNIAEASVGIEALPASHDMVDVTQYTQNETDLWPDGAGTPAEIASQPGSQHQPDGAPGETLDWGSSPQQQTLADQHPRHSQSVDEDELTSSQLLQAPDEYDVTKAQEQPSADDDLDLPDPEDNLDLTVPEPEGGWDVLSSQERDDESLADLAALRQTQMPKVQPRAAINISSMPVSSSPPGSSNGQLSEYGAKMLYTQDVLNAETQIPDLDVPPPDDDDDYYEELPENPLGQQRKQLSSKNAQSQQQDLAEANTLNDDDIDDYITTLSLRHGYSVNEIAAALEATSMRPELAELVLLEQKAGKGMPEDIPGIWTKEDDAVAESGDARKLKQLDRKHGWDEVAARLDFLKEWRQT